MSSPSSVIAIDITYSTVGPNKRFNDYKGKVVEIVDKNIEKFGKDNVRIFVWGGSCAELSLRTYKNVLNSSRAIEGHPLIRSSTSVSSILTSNQFIDALSEPDVSFTIITDGDIHPSNTIAAEPLFAKYKIKESHLHVFYLNGYDENKFGTITNVFKPISNTYHEKVLQITDTGETVIDSVSCCSIERTEQQTLINLIFSKMSTLDEFNEFFDKHKTDMKEFVHKFTNANKFRTFQPNNFSAHNIQLLRRLGNASLIDRSKIPYFTNKEICESNDPYELIRNARPNISKEFKDQLGRIIGFISGSQSYRSVINQTYDSGISAEEINEVIENIDLNEPETQTEFICPISYVEDVPYIIIDEGDNVLCGFDKPQLDAFANNPLSIVDNEDLVVRIRNRIPTMVGGNFIRLYLENKDEYSNIINPYTRRRIVGIIPFGTDKDSIRHANTELRRLFFGTSLYSQYKYINSELLYIVIWLLLQGGKLIPEYDSIKEYADTVLKHRCEHKRSYVSLTGNPEMGMVSASITVGIWYILSSWKDTTKLSPFRFHINNIRGLLKVYKNIGCTLPIDEEKIINIEKYLSHVLYLSKHAEDLVNVFKSPSLFNGATTIEADNLCPNSQTNSDRIYRNMMMYKAVFIDRIYDAMIIDNRVCVAEFMPDIKQLPPLPETQLFNFVDKHKDYIIAIMNLMGPGIGIYEALETLKLRTELPPVTIGAPTVHEYNCKNYLDIVFYKPKPLINANAFTLKELEEKIPNDFVDKIYNYDKDPYSEQCLYYGHINAIKLGEAYRAKLGGYKNNVMSMYKTITVLHYKHKKVDYEKFILMLSKEIRAPILPFHIMRREFDDCFDDLKKLNIIHSDAEKC